MTERVSTERLFPILKADQIERAAAHGQNRAVKSGEVLVEPGTANTSLFIVKSGQLEIIWPDPGETTAGPVAKSTLTSACRWSPSRSWMFCVMTSW